MSDQSSKWDKQWSELLTRCHGRDVEVNADFKARLLSGLKRKTAENLDAASGADAEEANWKRLLKTSYIPCHSDPAFKTGLLKQLKNKQAAIRIAASSPEDEAIRTILSKSYQPIEPRREFQTRLLVNLKERQRSTAQTRRRSRRRTLFLSAASSVAAAAAVMFVVWLTPHNIESGRATQQPIQARGPVLYPVPEEAIASRSGETTIRTMPAAYSPDLAYVDAPAAVAEFSTADYVSSDYSIDDVFSGPSLPEYAFVPAVKNSGPLRCVEMNTGDGWVALEPGNRTPMVPGAAFRATDAVGHLSFADGSLLTLGTDTMLAVTAAGLSVTKGFAMVEVPDESDTPFRLHFAERDLAIETGTILAALVEPAEQFAEGGAPAPLVMLADRDNAPGGFALAKGRNGVGPLFAKQVYRLDNYITAELPGRTMCDTECEDLSKVFKTERVVQSGYPASAFASTGSPADWNAFGSYGGTSSLLISPAGYSKRGDRWVADSYDDKQTTMKIKYLSNEYFGFANSRRDLGMALALGANVILDGGDGTFYEIIK